ncbi:MAG TPA: Tudor-knot domain-containing protein [Gemmataceae bacterium]|jgi:hypothetical protein|nr:Tudor-knot domain-containing protein [Gemmataceae bacterium]
MHLFKRVLCLLFLVALPATPAPLHADGRWEPANTYAVIVGVLKWEDPSLTTYPARHRKDQELYDTLARCGVSKKKMALLLDEHATLGNIRRSLREVSQRTGKGATLIFYYAGHGTMTPEGTVNLLNYDVGAGQVKKPALAVADVAGILGRDFKGARVLLLADCCHSGGLKEAARTLARAGIHAASLTSADAGNESTGSWMFTQTVLDALNGDPSFDANGDGVITLGELAAQVSAAMKYCEMQRSAYSTHGLSGAYQLVAVRGKRHRLERGPFTLDEYVWARDGQQMRPGRIVDFTDGKYWVELSDYSDKRIVKRPAAELAKINFKTYKVGATVTVTSQGQPYQAKVLKVAGDFHRISYRGWPAYWDEWVLSNRIVDPALRAKQPVQVKWEGQWWPAVVLKTEGKRQYIHYDGFEDSWDEWVTQDRIRFPVHKK